MPQWEKELRASMAEMGQLDLMYWKLRDFAPPVRWVVFVMQAGAPHWGDAVKSNNLLLRL